LISTTYLEKEGNSMLRRRILPAVVLIALVVSGCAARKPGSALKPGFNLFSKEQDIELGREAAAQVRQQYQEVRDQALNDYIAKVGQQLARQPEVAGFPYSFTLLNDKSVNAFALPGGPTFVFTGLLQAADNEGQLAGVMAHEIAHVALRHGTNQASKANLIQLPAMLAGAVVGDGSLLGQLAQVGIGLGANSVLLRYSRDAENQADALGARIMASAGYNPLEMARFFEKLEAEGGARAPQFLSSHPNPGNRVRAVEAEIQTLPRGSYTGETGQFPRMKTLVAQLPAPPQSPAASREAVPSAPAGDFRELRGDGFRLAYPANWEVYGQSGSNMFTLAPRQGLVQTRGGAVSIGYGAMASYYFPESRSRDLRSATEDLIRQLRATNPGMEVRSRGRSLRVSGAPALVTVLSGGSPFGGAEINWLVTVARPEGLFYLVFIAPERDFANLENTFNRMLSSLQFNS
jgi:beta-barrel assembly-enhancing protease